MNRVLSIFILLTLLAGAGPAQTTLMYVKLKDGTVRSFDIADITKVTFGTVTGVIDPQKLSPLMKTFVLYQNFPNPFNPATTIRYAIPRGGVVDVAIFDLSGRRVKEYIREYSRAGDYAIEWNGVSDDGSVVASGLYFYQTRFENAVVSRKMIFLK